jgi:hypothetical protein
LEQTQKRIFKFGRIFLPSGGRQKKQGVERSIAQPPCAATRRLKNRAAPFPAPSRKVRVFSGSRVLRDLPESAAYHDVRITQGGEPGFYGLDIFSGNMLQEYTIEAGFRAFYRRGKPGFKKFAFQTLGVIMAAKGGDLECYEGGSLFLGFYDFEFYLCDSPRRKTDNVRGGPGQINNSVLDKGAAVVDAHDNRFSVFGFRYPDFCTETEGFVRRGKFVCIEDFPVCGFAAMKFAAVPGRKTFFFKRGSKGRREKEGRDEGRFQVFSFYTHSCIFGLKNRALQCIVNLNEKIRISAF